MSPVREREVEDRIVPQPEPEAEPKSLGELASRIVRRLGRESGR